MIFMTACWCFYSYSDEWRSKGKSFYFSDCYWRRKIFSVSVYGDNGALHWRQENPNFATFNKVGKPNQIITRGGPIQQDGLLAKLRIPPGHPEGFLEAFAQIYTDLADVIQGSDNSEEIKIILPNENDGLQIMKFINASVNSSKNNSILTDLSSI